MSESPRARTGLSAIFSRVNHAIEGDPSVSIPTPRSLSRRLALPAVATLIAVAMAWSLAGHSGPMLRAAGQLEVGALALAFLLSMVYRAVNATGWSLILRALGEPVGAVASARIWLASEACRWLPGSLWSFGSRALLATRRGLGGPTVAASLALELAVTVVAWAVVAGLGVSSLRWPMGWSLNNPSALLAWGGGAVVVVGLIGLYASRSSRMRAKLSGVFRRFDELRHAGVDRRALLGSFLFYVAMGLFNGLILVVLVRSIPGGESCPLRAVVAANAVAWLVGFFALFSPGGLVVREACLATLLSPWLDPERVILVALAWRLVQIASEAVCFAAVAARGLPASLKVEPTPTPPTREEIVPSASS